MLHRDKNGRAWRYLAARGEGGAGRRVMAEVLRSGGNRLTTIRCFTEQVSDEDMESLRIAGRP